MYLEKIEIVNISNINKLKVILKERNKSSNIDSQCQQLEIAKVGNIQRSQRIVIGTNKLNDKIQSNIV
ncbi:unnamed protein product [Paramecium octaurelia]|uniref:Uncharacterized protein n=1 Tax=Paramecium octaurelia TaxID=43137 RepID=A0A8S1WPY5_PAROT|nr:unnamed protein product [Paramecium octaurelia]